MRAMIKRVGESPKLYYIKRGDFHSQREYMRLFDEYAIDPDRCLIALYNGDLPTSKDRNFKVHSDGSLICGTVYIVRKTPDGAFHGLPPVEQEIAYNWLGNRCSWTRKDDG